MAVRPRSTLCCAIAAWRNPALRRAYKQETRWLDSWLPDLQLAATLADQNDEVLAADDAYNGFVRLTLTPEEMTGEWMSVSTITSRQFTCFPLRRFSAKPDEMRLKG